MKILITGFEPFLQETINPSRELAESFRNQHDVVILPVSYRRAIEVLRPHLETTSYDLVLMLGQAGGRKTICLERVAINLEDTGNPDEDGDLRLEASISLEGPKALFTSLPLRDLSEKLKAQNHPVSVSLSAGAFVCNSLYYQVLHWIEKKQQKAAALFVHVPYIPEQLAGKPADTPSLELSQMKEALQALLDLVKS